MIGTCEGFIDRYLRDRCGDEVVHDLGELCGAHRWRLELGPGDVFLRVDLDALEVEPELVESWLEYVVEDLRDAAPTSPGYYHVDRGGVSVRGMDEVTFTEHGQEVRCRVDDSGESPFWRIEVDGADCGEFRAAEPEDERDRVAAAAVAFLQRHCFLRQPPEPWQLSAWTTRATSTGSG